MLIETLFVLYFLESMQQESAPRLILLLCWALQGDTVTYSTQQSLRTNMLPGKLSPSQNPLSSSSLWPLNSSVIIYIACDEG